MEWFKEIMTTLQGFGAGAMWAFIAYIIYKTAIVAITTLTVASAVQYIAKLIITYIESKSEIKSLKKIKDENGNDIYRVER